MLAPTGLRLLVLGGRFGSLGGVSGLVGAGWGGSFRSFWSFSFGLGSLLLLCSGCFFPRCWFRGLCFFLSFLFFLTPSFRRVIPTTC